MKTFTITVRDPEQERMERIHMEAMIERDRQERKKWQKENPADWKTVLENWKQFIPTK